MCVHRVDALDESIDHAIDAPAIGAHGSPSRVGKPSSAVVGFSQFDQCSTKIIGIAILVEKSVLTRSNRVDLRIVP